ncbi:hypothetical protein KVP70_33880, partial [Duganella sp. HSC-15S17]|nr:hypothetical protein [Duganella violaceicalia]
CQYRSALFTPATIEYLMGQWLSLLEQVARAPRTAVAQLALFELAPLASPYLAFANALPATPAPATVLERLRAVTVATPDGVALEW